jgi:predicted O-linked N-acetylglucosamine transferase (SPINDLY family)
MAKEPPALEEIRQKLAHNRAVAPLFDTDRFRRHIERAYVEMWERNQRGESPDSLQVAAVT